MKMVSQLTRQAMNRHRLIASAPYSPPAASSYAPPPTVLPLSPEPSPLPPSPPLPGPPAFPDVRPIQPAPRQTLYGQLMKKHDRFTERHIPRP